MVVISRDMASKRWVLIDLNMATRVGKVTMMLEEVAGETARRSVVRKGFPEITSTMPEKLNCSLGSRVCPWEKVRSSS